MEKIEKGQRKGRRVGCCERSKRVECAGESGRTAYHHYRSLPLLVPSLSPSLFRAWFSVFYSPTPASLRPLLSAVFSLSLSIVLFSLPLIRPTDPSAPLYFSFAGSVAVLSWARERCSVESSRNASDSTRLRLRALREFFSLRDEGRSCASTDARSSALRDKGRPASRRSAPRVRLVYTYTHIYKRAHTNRLLPTLASYVHHADTLAYTTSAATIATLLFFFLLFFVFLPPISSLLLPLPRLILLYHYIYSITTSFSFKSFFLYCLCLFIFLLFFYYSLWLEWCVIFRCVFSRTSRY